MKRAYSSHRDDCVDRKRQQRAPRSGDNKAGEGSVYKQLRVQPLSQYAGSFPVFREPRELGVFSQDSNRVFRHNNSQLRYFVPPEDFNSVEYNLRSGYRQAILRDDSVKEYLGDLLKWLTLNRKCFQTSTRDPNVPTTSLNTDFICWRGLLTKVLCTPYENREGWIIAVTLFNGTFYMCEFDTQERIEQRRNQNEKEKEMSYWGYKFEQYLTSDKEDGTPCTETPVNNNEGYGSVVRTRLKNHSLVYGGEVDCCEKTSHGTKYIELKTSRELYTSNNERNFKRFKLIKWWAQSFLLGIPKIIGGFRDDDGVVRRLEAFETLRMPKMVQDLRDPWDANICFNFLDKFLQFVKNSVKDDNYRIVHLFQRTPAGSVTVEKLREDSEYCFLPKWFVEGTLPP